MKEREGEKMVMFVCIYIYMACVCVMMIMCVYIFCCFIFHTHHQLDRGVSVSSYFSLTTVNEKQRGRNILI